MVLCTCNVAWHYMNIYLAYGTYYCKEMYGQVKYYTLFFCEHTTYYRHPHQTMHHKARYNTSLQRLMFSTRGSRSRFGCLSKTPKKTTIHINLFVGTFFYKQTCLSNLCCIVLFQTNHGTLQVVKSDS